MSAGLSDFVPADETASTISRENKIMNKFIMLLAALPMLMLTGCKESEVPVNLHGVNYSGQIFSYVLVDPANSNNAGGGETIDPYGAGGTMCCYTLPAKWTPGMKVQINATHWLPRKADGSLPEIKETQVVEVPRYVDGKPAELWVLRGADGKISLISSDYQPDHEKWPGKIKGWPVPSLEYRRERADLYISVATASLASSERYLKELEYKPNESIEGSWNALREKFPDELIGFSGPGDPKFKEKVRDCREKLVIKDREELQELKKGRP